MKNKVLLLFKSKAMNGNLKYFKLIKWQLSLLIILFCCFSFHKANAQSPFDCVDTSRINPYFLCGKADYIPVCGCDANDYRNDCAAEFMGGVNTWVTGTCGNFGFDIVQNPVAYDLPLFIYTKQKERVLVQVWSLFGKIVFSYTFIGNELSVQQPPIDTNGWERGVYVVLVIVNGEYKAQKIVKVDSL